MWEISLILFPGFDRRREYDKILESVFLHRRSGFSKFDQPFSASTHFIYLFFPFVIAAAPGAERIGKGMWGMSGILAGECIIERNGGDDEGRHFYFYECVSFIEAAGPRRVFSLLTG